MQQQTPFPIGARRGSGVSFLVACALALLPAASARAGDGATEALELRLHAEHAIAQERISGQPGLADAMTGMLPGLLLEYLASRDETIALDVVDAAAVRHEVVAAKLMQEPGLAWALDVFAGPGTGHEHELRTAMASLADFQGARAERGMERVMEAAVDVYERQVQRDLERADKLQEKQQELELRKAEVALAKVADRAERFAEKKAEQVTEKVEKIAEKTVEKAEQQAEKQAEKVEKEAEKAQEKSAKETEKVAKEIVQQEEQAEKEAEKQEAPKDDKKDGKKGTRD